MKTEKLYHKDPYKISFQATILEKYVDRDKHVLILDKTIFYPNSGGQICDRGIIEGISVIDVEEHDGKVIHFLEKEVFAGIGDSVSGNIDWPYRFDHMQQHTGQHILSGALMKLWERDTQSFHMGSDICTLDISYIDIDDQKIIELESLSNQVIYEDRVIMDYFVENTDTRIDRNTLRIKQKHFEQLRIIEIADFDLSACGGTHCNRTGEVGIIKIIGWEKDKDK